MTEQEAEALVLRLKGVWLCDEHQIEVENEDFFSLGASFNKPGIAQEISLYIADIDGKMFYRLSRYGASLFYEKGVGISNGSVANEKFQSSFSAQWLGFFRRGLWLSGCDIEATTHEKAEWMQGFSQEELQAWDLKM